MIYTIHMDRDAVPVAGDKSGESRFDSLTAIPDGKATWALIAPPVWLVIHKLWWAFSFYCLVVFFLLALLTTQYFLVPAILGGLPGLYLWLEGHQLRREKALRNGLFHVGTVEAVNDEEALERFLTSWDASSKDVKPHQFSKTTNDKLDNLAFGIFPEIGT